jgi:hypothetical protein
MRTVSLLSLLGAALVSVGLLQIAGEDHSPIGKTITRDAMKVSLGASGFFQQCPGGPTTNCAGPAACAGVTCTTVVVGIQSPDGTVMPTSSYCQTTGGTSGCTQPGAYAECQWCLTCVWCSQGGRVQCGSYAYPQCTAANGYGTFWPCDGGCVIVVTTNPCNQDC